MAIFYLLILILLIGLGLYIVFLGLGFPFHPLNLIGEKRIIFPGFALIAVALEIGFLWLVYIRAPTPQASVAEAFRYAFAYSAAAAIKSKTVFPVFLGPGIELLNITSNKGNVVREYEVQVQNDDDFRTSMDSTKAWLDKTACADPNNLPIMRAHMGVELWFHQSNAPYVQTIVYMPKDCGL